MFKEYFTTPSREYYLAKPLETDRLPAQIITFDTLCTLLKEKNCIFYTGAGISAGNNVATMHNLQKSLYLINESTEKPSLNYTLLKMIFFNPKAITNAFAQFCISAINTLPTAAHYALHELAHIKNTSIVTENVDLLHQRTGSIPVFTHSDEMHAVTPADLKEIDIIVCIGLSHDDCGFLRYYKESNPNGLLIALNLEQPAYISHKDLMVKEDIQLILPKLAKAMKKQKP
jgi:NAD-dependent deacetylase